LAQCAILVGHNCSKNLLPDILNSETLANQWLSIET